MLYTRIEVNNRRDLFADNVIITISNHPKNDMFTLVRIVGTDGLPSKVSASRMGEFNPLELLQYSQALQLGYEIYTVWNERLAVPMEYDNVSALDKTDNE